MTDVEDENILTSIFKESFPGMLLKNILTSAFKESFPGMLLKTF